MNAERTRPQCYLTPFAMRSRIARDQPLGLPVINMAYNELPFEPSVQVAAAISQACNKANRYGDPACRALQEQICQHNTVTMDTIICGNGSEELLDVIARNFVQPGDEIVISEFGYIQFELIANRLNALLTKAPEKEFTADTDALLASISSRTKLVFLANPNNPTGTLMVVSEIERLLDRLPPHIVLVLDLAYGEFAGKNYCAQIHAMVETHNNLVVTRTFSKAYALAGLRIGWCHAPSWMIPGFYAARGMGTVNAVAQAAAIAAIRETDLVGQRVGEIVEERKRVAKALESQGVIVLPSEANFLLLSVDGLSAAETEALVDFIFDTAGILVTYSREGGLEKFLRVSLSLREHNDKLIRCIKEYPGLRRV